MPGNFSKKFQSRTYCASGAHHFLPYSCGERQNARPDPNVCYLIINPGQKAGLIQKVPSFSFLIIPDINFML